MDYQQSKSLLPHAEQLLKELMLRTSRSPRLDEMHYYDTFVEIMERLYRAEQTVEALQDESSNLELENEELRGQVDDLEFDLRQLKTKLSAKSEG